MYLPSKLQRTILAVLAVSLLLIVPLRAPLEHALLFCARQLSHSPRTVARQFEVLTEENLSLRLQLAELEQLRRENEILRQAFDFKLQRQLQLLGVEVVAFSPSGWRRSVIVNAGKDQGIERGFFVIDEQGRFVGSISEVQKNFSRVLMASDPSFSVPVFVGKQGLGLLKGTVSGAKILYIEDADTVALNDPVWLKIPSTECALDIGTVTNIKKKEQDLFWDVDARLLYKVSVLDKLFILK